MRKREERQRYRYRYIESISGLQGFTEREIYEREGGQAKREIKKLRSYLRIARIH